MTSYTPVPPEPAYHWDAVRYTTLGRYLLRRELAFIQKALAGRPRPRLLLEIGCGSGRITLPLRTMGIEVMGVDMNMTALRVLRRQSATMPLVQCDAQMLPWPDGYFDCVIAIQCFDYFDRNRFFQECQRTLCPGGTLIFDTLNRQSYKWLLKMLLGRSLDLPSANLSYRQIAADAAAVGFEIHMVSGYNWVPFPRDSDSRLVSVAAYLEHALQLERYYRISPKILVAATKQC